MNDSLRAQCIAEFLGTGLFLFFGIGCLSALPEGRGCQFGIVGDLYHMGLGDLACSLPDSRDFWGPSQSRYYHRTLVVCLFSWP